VRVGYDQKPWLWHRKTIYSASPHLTALIQGLNPPPVELSINQNMRLDPGSVTIIMGTSNIPTITLGGYFLTHMDLITDWLYSRHFPTNGTSLSHMSSLYVCAIMLDMEAFQNDLMDAMQQVVKVESMTDGEVSMALHWLLFFNTTYPLSKARQYLIDLIATWLKTGEKQLEQLNQPDVQALFKQAELSQELFNVVLKQERLPDISWNSPQRYHRHTGNVACYCMYVGDARSRTVSDKVESNPSSTVASLEAMVKAESPSHSVPTDGAGSELDTDAVALLQAIGGDDKGVHNEEGQAENQS
jgi:hypothetical protein